MMIPFTVHVHRRRRGQVDLHLVLDFGPFTRACLAAADAMDAFSHTYAWSVRYARLRAEPIEWERGEG